MHVWYSYCQEKSREMLMPLLADVYVQQVVDSCCLVVQRSAHVKVVNWLRENITSS